MKNTIKESVEKLGRLIDLGFDPNRFSSIQVFNTIDVIDKTVSSRVACIFEPSDDDELLVVVGGLIKLGFEQQCVMESCKSKYSCFRLDEISIQIKVPV